MIFVAGDINGDGRINVTDRNLEVLKINGKNDFESDY